MAFRAERFRDFRESGPTSTTQKRQLKISRFFQVVWLAKCAQTISMSGVEMRRKKTFVVKCLRHSHHSSTDYARTTAKQVMIGRERLRDVQKNVYAKRAKILFLIVKYADLCRSCHLSIRGCLSSFLEC